MTELGSHEIKRVFSMGFEQAGGSASRFGAPGLVREAVREAERATHRLRVERDTEACRRKRSELALEELSRRTVEGPGDARIVSVEGLNESASGAATTQRALRAKTVELKLSIDAHARRIAELDQAIADAILRIRLLSEPDVFVKEQG